MIMACPSPQDQVHSAFSFLLDPAREWALDFLLNFSSDAAGDVSALSNAISFSFGDSTTTTTTFSTPSNPPLPTSSVETNELLVPVWQCADVVCGITVLLLDQTSPSASPTPSRVFAIGRFARDEKTGEATKLFSTIGAGCVRARAPEVFVAHARLHGARRLVQTRVRCDAARARGARKGAGRFARAAVASERVRLERSCPVCVSAEAACGCELAFAVAKPGLDFLLFRQNSALAYGEYGGEGEILEGSVSQEDDFKVTSMHVQYRACPRGGERAPNDSLSLALKDVAIQERLLSGTVDQDVMHMFGAHLPQLSFADGIEIAFRCAGERGQRLSPTDVQGFTNHDHTDEQGAICSTFFYEKAFAADKKLFPDPALSLQHADSLASSPEPGWLHASSEIGSFELDVLSGEQLSEKWFSTSETPCDSRALSCEFTKKKKLDRIEKNRAAATRSNLRRREYRVTLVQTLEDEKKKLEGLRAQEATLKAINLGLKAQVGDTCRGEGYGASSPLVVNDFS